MAITRTAKGTAGDKTTSLTLSLNSVQLEPGALLVVGLTYDDGNGAPTVKWGQRLLKPKRTVAGNGIVTRIVSMVYGGDENRTRNIVATWDTAAPTAKVMFASMIKEADSLDVTAAQAEALTTDPDSGTAINPTKDSSICIAAFGHEGPAVDTVGTLQNGYSSGQRIGVAGAPPVSNVTIHEAYKILTTSESTSAAKTGTTARDWCTVLVVFDQSTTVGKGISPTDIAAVEEIFETANLDVANMVLKWNYDEERFEAYEVDLTAETAICYFDETWITV